MKKTFAIVNFIVVLMLAAYLVSLAFIEYPRILKLAILAFYFIFAIVRYSFFIWMTRKHK